MQSLLDQHPNTMLARLASETWNGQGKEDEEIFIERDGERFRYVLDFLRHGKVLLPLCSEPKANSVRFRRQHNQYSAFHRVSWTPSLSRGSPQAP